MGTKVTVSVAVLLISSFLLSALVNAIEDPEVKQCKHQCDHLRDVSYEQKEKCKERCDNYYREKKAREQEQEEKGSQEGGGSDGDSGKHLRRCKKQCERWEGGEERQLCRFRCQKRWKGGGDIWVEEATGERSENPYVFDEHYFSSRAKTEHGRIDVLDKFTEKSELLRGIENYRVGLLVADPQTFVMPTHFDADAVIFVAKGRGTITMVRRENRESFNVECGDILRIRAGTPVYVINRDETEQLEIIKLLVPVNVPGEYEAFRSAGGSNPESFYTAFSWKILEAALQTSRERMERLFRQQDQGSIVKASGEQIQAMSRHAQEEGGTIWPFTEPKEGPFNLLRHRPSHANNFGQIFEARPDYHKQLQDLNLLVSFVNITKDSMFGPFYNSRATKIAFVVDGEGYFEMACPHVSSSSSPDHNHHRHGQGESGPTYHKISGRLRKNMVFIVPAGHPVAAVASANNNLQFLCFEVNAQGNIKYPLAGKRNVVKNMEREAKELAFKTKADEVERIFGRQDEELFFPGPREQGKEEARAYA